MTARRSQQVRGFALRAWRLLAVASMALFLIACSERTKSDGVKPEMPSQSGHPGIQFKIPYSINAQGVKVDVPRFVSLNQWFAFGFPLSDIPGIVVPPNSPNFQQWVTVLKVEAAPQYYFEENAPGDYPKNVYKRAVEKYPEDIEVSFIKYGTNCYINKLFVNPPKTYCFRLGVEGKHDVFLTFMHRPWPQEIVNPMLTLEYSAKYFGGVTIFVRTHADNIVYWKEIDDYVWSMLHQWQIK